MLALLMASLTVLSSKQHLLSSQNYEKPHTVKAHTEKYVATAYTAHEKDGGGSITSTGHHVHHGIIAVDPRVIPYGTKLYVPGYGFGVADDCGGLIKGRRIDVYLGSRSECNRWGRRKVNITIYPNPHPHYVKHLHKRRHKKHHSN